MCFSVRKDMFILFVLNPLKTRNIKMGTLTNNEDPDEMSHDAAFHQSLHCFLRQHLYSEKETQYIFLKIISCWPSIYTMNNSDINICFFMENSIGLKRLNIYVFFL